MRRKPAPERETPGFAGGRSLKRQVAMRSGGQAHRASAFRNPLRIVEPDATVNSIPG